jgi:hypothetical protein
MMHSKRYPVNKRKSAHSFNRNEPKRHGFNLAVARGGFRL